MKAKGDYLNQVHSDQIALERMRLSCMSSGQKQLKKGHQARVYSDQMILVMARQGGWTAARQWSKALKT